MQLVDARGRPPSPRTVPHFNDRRPWVSLAKAELEDAMEGTVLLVSSANAGDVRGLIWEIWEPLFFSLGR